jgi:hypothetical protein
VNSAPFANIEASVTSFTNWLDTYGETSYDHQSFFASDFGRAAKALYYRKPMLGTLAVAPMIFCEAFVPSARTLFWKPQRFPIADAHYAMGFAYLAALRGEDKYYKRAVHFLEVLVETRSHDYKEYGWGYPFDWETRTGTFKAGTPLITTLPYAYEAFSAVYELDKDKKWLEIMRSIAKHALDAYRDKEVSPGVASCGYMPGPDDPCGVVNASAYRAFLLTKAAVELQEPKYLEVANRNLKFVMSAQNPDGSWYYSMDGSRDFVDHFHTCFVLKALAKIEKLRPQADVSNAIARGVAYYASNLVDSQGLPLPFSKRPRMTVYKRELYDYAECVNLATLLSGRFEKLDRVLSNVLTDVFDRWQNRGGSFRARELFLGWDNVPMHRWAQSQMFRSLCFLLLQSARPQVAADESSRLIESKAAN